MQKNGRNYGKVAGASKQRDKAVDQWNFLSNENADEQQKFYNKYEGLLLLSAERAVVMEETIVVTSNEMASKSHNKTNCDDQCRDASSKNKIVWSRDDRLEEVFTLKEENREHTQNVHNVEEKIQQYENISNDFKKLGRQGNSGRNYEESAGVHQVDMWQNEKMS